MLCCGIVLCYVGVRVVMNKSYGLRLGLDLGLRVRVKVRVRVGFRVKG